jgi:CubicO group peptidase (beta-lactamase class C family)
VHRTQVLTLPRHLLTHAAGLTYDVVHPDLIKIAQKKGKVPGTGDTILERFGYPLIFEPGTNWIYGPGIDWAGKLVERVTGQTLEEQ